MYFKAIYINRVSTFALLLSHQEETFQKCPKRWQSPFLFFYYQKILGHLGIHYVTKVIQITSEEDAGTCHEWLIGFLKRGESCFTRYFSEDIVLNL